MVVGWFLLWEASGCTEAHHSQKSSQNKPTRPGDTASRQAVAVINGTPIFVEDVEKTVKSAAIAGRHALALLETEWLLAEEAQKRGYSADPEAELVGKQAAVQELLIERVEREVRVTDGDLEAAYERERRRFHQPELRASVHVLAKIGRAADPKTEHAAEHLAREALRAFAKENNPEKVLDRFRRRASATLEIVAERLPLISKEEAIAPAYKEALFGLTQPGVVKAPIRTSFGWHAIYLTEIRPAQTRTVQEVAELLTPQLLLEKRSARVKSIVDAVRRSTPVVPNPSEIQWLMQAELPVLSNP